MKSGAFVAININNQGRSPHGERGLKFRPRDPQRVGALSLPTRGAWIEIFNVQLYLLSLARSLPTRGAWIEIRWGKPLHYRSSSLPTRGAWIEMIFPLLHLYRHYRRSPHGERGLKSHKRR